MKPKTIIVQQKQKVKEIRKNGIKKKKYDPNDLKKALNAVHEGMSHKQAAKKFNVPRSTIQYRVNHRGKVGSRPGPSTILTTEEEKTLVNWIIESDKKGFPKGKKDLQYSVTNFLLTTNRPNPFKNSTPGKKWLTLFLKRHPEITMQTSETATDSSTIDAENDIRKWFEKIEVYLKENELFEVLSDPNRVLNGDETNFLLCPKTGTVLEKSSEKKVHDNDDQEKTAITVIFTFTASGHKTPPMVVFPYERLPSEIATKVPTYWGVGLSDNGMMKADLFQDYIESVLYPHLLKIGTVFPVILFINGNKTHLTLQLSDLCSELNIVLVALYPDSIGIHPPAKVSAFYPLKRCWKKSVLNWRKEHPIEPLTKFEFVPILKEALDKLLNPATLIEGFRAYGLYPWNSDALNYSNYSVQDTSSSRDLPNSTVPENTNSNSESSVISKEKFIEIVGLDTIAFLEQSEIITGPDVLLKQLWNCYL